MIRRMFLSLLASFLVAASTLAAPQHVERAKRPLARGAQEAPPPAPNLAAIAARLNPNGSSAAVLIDVASGAILESYQGGKPMAPASVTKVVTTLFGIARLGSDFSFTTRLLASGPVQGGIIQGDLTLVGGGDPSLDSDELVLMIEQLKAAGIRGITGDFLFDASLLPHVVEIDDGQPVEAAYNPGVSGLNLNFNRVYFQWNGPDQVSLKARAEHHAPLVERVSMVTSNRAGPVYEYSYKNGRDHWDVLAGALKGEGASWLPVRNPAPYAAEVFRTLARDYGVILPFPQVSSGRAKGREVARMERRELKLVCRGMLHFSTNLTAEVIGLRASGASSLGASGRAMEAWAKEAFGVSSPSFRDHSGLGDLNRISAQDMAQIVAVSGKRGDLEGLLRRYFVPSGNGNKPVDPNVEVRAKTGTLNFVRGLSGLIEGKGGRRLAFAIFSSDLEALAASNGGQAKPRGSRRFANRARSFERLVLRDWILTHAR